MKISYFMNSHSMTEIMFFILGVVNCAVCTVLHFPIWLCAGAYLAVFAFIVQLVRAVRMFTSVRYFIRSYLFAPDIEYVEIKYSLTDEGKIHMNNFNVLGWKYLSIQNIIEYDRQLKSLYLKPITKKQYEKYKMLEELKK